MKIVHGVSVRSTLRRGDAVVWGEQQAEDVLFAKSAGFLEQEEKMEGESKQVFEFPDRRRNYVCMYLMPKTSTASYSNPPFIARWANMAGKSRQSRAKGGYDAIENAMRPPTLRVNKGEKNSMCHELVVQCVAGTSPLVELQWLDVLGA